VGAPGAIGVDETHDRRVKSQVSYRKGTPMSYAAAALVVAKLDRLSRSMIDFTALMKS